MENLRKDIEKVLFSHEEIVIASKRIAKEIEEDYKDKEKEPVLLCTLKGALPFMAELMKHIDIHVVTDFIDVASYHGGTESTGSIILRKDVTMDLENRDVIVVEDIVDTGRTLNHLLNYLRERNVKSVACASLVDKPEARLVDVQAEYVGIESPNEFLVGFGLDYEEKYRNLPYIGVLKPEIYS
ncbi:hypoxanthine phosphoribosyltransferase [Gemelliphila palaticanis]|uniref:Hypoxanthine phosphoribosyltransferase n=1 Tax=Gemelliphila palaticanis TaxID=81950 RepID=A0ABX2SZ38_9BACL|nr:hypoxanthine phosphoribosyltransferase [Gemella palaticanis]MBF0715387.1 hypoxanthine phosphoribosyltransferase [Gemella palaticanis]NYS47317.1 hypoxanthine phosphoribosyltransferase [Gemella palaticanis]